MTVELFPLLLVMFIASVANAALLKYCRSCDPIAVFFSFAIIIVFIAFALVNNMTLFAALGVAAILGLMVYYAEGEEEPPNQSQ